MTDNEINYPVNEISNKKMDEVKDTSPIEKQPIKKERSQKQLESFKNAQIKRAENIKNRNDDTKEKKRLMKIAKLMLPNTPAQPPAPPQTQTQTQKIVEPPKNETDDDEEEIIYIKKPKRVIPKPMKLKKKTIIIEESSDEDTDNMTSSDSDEEEQPKAKTRNVKQFKTQQNKKSIQKPHVDTYNLNSSIFF